MRPAIFSLLVSSPAMISAYESVISDGCVQGNFHDLVIRNSCGDDLSIVKCLAEDVDLRRLDQIEQCFIAGGCDAIDSTVSAVWFSYECNDRQGSAEEVVKEDLRKRATETSEESTTTEASSSTSSSASTTAATTTTSASASSSSSASAASSTTATSSSSTTGSAASASTTASTGSSTSGTSTSATSSGTGTSSSTLACSTTSYYSTSYCSYGTGKSTGVTLGCVATSAASSKCAPGVLCTTAASGKDTCMPLDNSLTTSGLVITIFFAVSLGAFLIGITIIGCKDRQTTKKLKAERIARLDAESKEALESYNQKRSRSVRQPEAFGHSEADLPLIERPRN